MAYFNIVFHNIQKKTRAILGNPLSIPFYLNFPGSVTHTYRINRLGEDPNIVDPATVHQFGHSVSNTQQAHAIFFCESGFYQILGRPRDYNPAWDAHHVSRPTQPLTGTPYNGYFPLPPPNALPSLSYMFNGVAPATVTYLPNVTSFPWIHPPRAQYAEGFIPGNEAYWENTNSTAMLRSIGSNAFLNGDQTAELGGHFPLWGSTKYGIIWYARKLYVQSGLIAGLFVHVKNTPAGHPNNGQTSPGTQIAALCKKFPHLIIHGDLNLNIDHRHLLNRIALKAAVSDTHQLLYLDRIATRYEGTAGTAILDYALVPNAHIQHVVIGARVIGGNGVAEHLDTGQGAGITDANHQVKSDHAVMCLTINCAD